ncbi:MAG: peptidylprolyl isomerase [Tepidisphaerales bacterium]
MKIRKSRMVALLAGSLAIGSFAFAQDKKDVPAEKTPDPSTVIITMGDQKITYGEFASYLSVLPPETQAQAARGEGKRQAAEQLVQMRILAGEARAKGLDKTTGFQQQLQIMQDNILVGLLLQSVQDSLASEEEIKGYYEAHKPDFERLTARYILLLTRGDNAMKDDDAKAKIADIKKQLDGGADFEALAKVESMDPGSKKDGGKLPRFGRGEMPAELEKVAFALKVGETSDPVKTDFGYNIIKVEGRETASYDECKEPIANHLRQEKFQKMVDDLKKKADAKLDESFFGPPPKAPDAPKKEGEIAPPTK